MRNDTYRHKGMRQRLVQKIMSKGIKDPRILAAFEKVPRHYFFDEAFVEHAYQDKAFPIGEGQTISQPYTVAFQTELLEITKGDKVLEIGTGSGYQACILLELGAKVYTIEYQRKLYETTKKFLPEMGYYPYMVCGDGSKGFQPYAPYDKIIVTAGAPVVPKALVEQLNVGGKLVIPVGNNKSQMMMRLTKKGENQIIRESFDHFRFVPLKGESGWQ